MRLPLRLAAAAALAAGALVVLTGGVAAAHPGPTDASGIHQCTAADAAANRCTPAESSHRHTADGNMVLVTPPGGAAVTTTAAPVATTAPAAVAVTTTAPAVPVALPQDMARTGSGSMLLTIVGLTIAAAGAMALWSERLVPAPVVLELSRPRSD